MNKMTEQRELCLSCGVYLPGGLSWEVKVNLSWLLSTCSNKSLLADMHGDGKLLFFVPVAVMQRYTQSSIEVSVKAPRGGLVCVYLTLTYLSTVSAHGFKRYNVCCHHQGSRRDFTQHCSHKQAFTRKQQVKKMHSNESLSNNDPHR